LFKLGVKEFLKGHWLQLERLDTFQNYRMLTFRKR